MTEQRERQAQQATYPGLEVKPEIIADLDPLSEDADKVIGGCDAPSSPRPTVSH